MIVGVETISGVLLLILSARILEPKDFGTLIIITSMGALIFGFLSISGHETITTFVNEKLSKGENAAASRIIRMVFVIAYGLALCAYMLFSLVALVASELIGVAKNYTTEMLICGLAPLLLATQRENLAVLRLANRLSLGFMAVTGGAIARSIALFSVWYVDGKLIMVSLSIVVGAITTAAGLFVVTALSTGQDNLPHFFHGRSVKVSSDVIRFHFVSFCQTKFGTLFGNIDVIILGMVIGPVQTGFYGITRRLLGATTLLSGPLSLSIQIEYSRRWYHNKRASFLKLLGQSTIFMVGIASIIYGLLIILNQEMILLAFGPGYEETEIPLSIMIPGGFIFLAISALHVLPAAIGRALPSLIWTATAVIVQVITILLLVPSHGLVGAAWAYTISYFVLAFTVLIFCWKILRDFYYLKTT